MRNQPPRRHYKPLLSSAELPRICSHYLRHTCATMLLMAGKHPKYVQEPLGHASTSITLDTYSHIIEGMDGGLADAIDDALRARLGRYCCHRDIRLDPRGENSV